MDGRSRVKGAINRTPIDRIPFYCDELFRDTELRWLQEGLPAGETEREDLFEYDCTRMFVDASMRFEEKLLSEDDDTVTVADKFGFVATRNKHIPGIHYHEHAVKTPEDWARLRDRLRVDDADRSRIHEVTYFKPFEVWPTWPEAEEIFRRKRATGRYIVLLAYGPWEMLWRLRGFEQAMMDLVLERELVDDIVDHYTSFLIDVVSAAVRHGVAPDSFFLADDLGGNQGLLFSPQMAQEIFFPCYRRIGACLKERAIDFFFHSCGDVQTLFPAFADAGVQVMNPLQATVMDVVDLKATCGDRLTFLGNINSRTLHQRDVVFEEMRRKVPVAMKGGGFIFASDHSIPADLGLEAYRDILREARRIGTY